MFKIFAIQWLQSVVLIVEMAAMRNLKEKLDKIAEKIVLLAKIDNSMFYWSSKPDYLIALVKYSVF